jgi:hypothetical protein
MTSKQSKPRSNYSELLKFVVIPLILLTLGYFFSKHNPSSTSLKSRISHSSVPREEWSQETLSHYVKARSPVVFPAGQNPSKNFAALSKWQNLDHFASEIAPELKNVYQSQNSNFLYLDYTVGSAEIKRQARISGLPIWKTFSVSNMPTKEFFGHCENKDKFVYFSGKFSAIVSNPESR